MHVERMQDQFVAQPAAGKADDFLLNARVGGCEDDLDLGRAIGERQRDRQAVRDLMHLIMVEKETDPHARKTPSRSLSRTESGGLLGPNLGALMTAVAGDGLGLYRRGR